MRRPAPTGEAIGRLRGRLVAAGPLTRAELIACAALLTLLAAAVFGSHVVHGGFLMDDWSNAAKSKYLASCCGVGQTGQGLGFGAQFDTMLSDGPAGYHLGLPAVLPVVYFLFGIHMGLHLALAAMLGVAMSLGGFVLMRKLGMAPLHAGLIAALVLIFPYSDSTRLWAMASFNQVAVIIWMAGLFVALRGLRYGGRRAVLWHAAALVVYALAILFYELAGGLVVLSVAFYLLRGTWRQALVRWIPDVVVAYLALQYVKENTLPRPVLGFDEAAEHASFIGGQAVTVLSRTALPFGMPPRILLALLIALPLVGAVVSAFGRPAGDPLRAAMRHWLVVAGIGVVVVIAGYVTIVPATYGAPLDAGIENRVNMISAFGYVAIVYSAAMTTGLFLAHRLGRPPRLAVVVPVALSALMALGFLIKLDTDKGYYDESFHQGQATLAGVGRAFGPEGPPEASTTYVFNFPAFTAPGIPVFAWVWDMPGAMKMTFQDPSIAGFPMLPGTVMQCEDEQVFPNSSYGTGPGEAAPYGSAFFVDAAAGVKQRIDSQSECESAKERFQPGPLAPGSNCVLSGGGPATRLGWQCSSRPNT